MQGVFTIFKRGLSPAFYACFIDKKKGSLYAREPF
jgi:hypothetical protein